VIGVHPKADDGWRYLLRIFSKTAQCHRPNKSEKKIIFCSIFMWIPTFAVSPNSGIACSSSSHGVCFHNSGYILKNKWKTTC